MRRGQQARGGCAKQQQVADTAGGAAWLGSSATGAAAVGTSLSHTAYGNSWELLRTVRQQTAKPTAQALCSQPRQDTGSMGAAVRSAVCARTSRTAATAKLLRASTPAWDVCHRTQLLAAVLRSSKHCTALCSACTPQQQRNRRSGSSCCRCCCSSRTEAGHNKAAAQATAKGNCPVTESESENSQLQAHAEAVQPGRRRCS